MRRGNTTVILGLVISAVALIIILLLFSQMRDWLFKKPLDRGNCALQVQMHAYRQNISHGESSTPITCKTHYEEIERGKSDEYAKSMFAEHMKSCWDDWGKGEYYLYDEDGIYCHICSFITFEEDEGEVEGFAKYLYDTPVKGSPYHYVEYFTPGYDGPRFADQFQPITEGDELMKDQDYAVIFYYLRGEETYKTWFGEISKDAVQRPGAVAAGLGAGAVAGVAVGGAVGFGTYAALTAGVAGVTICSVITAGACAVIVLGTVAATGTVTAAVVGSTAASAADYYVNDPPNYASFLLVRPLDEANIEKLGCEYSFAGRKD